MIAASIVADSVSPEGYRLTTFKLRYPRFVHAEFMTHRMISRNASSSRATPFAKLLEEVRRDDLRAEPVYWGSEKKGMQTGEELGSDEVELPNHTGFLPRIDAAKWEWGMAALAAADHAERLSALGLHKSLCNRILEPFSHINVVASATEWGNFFGLRLHRDAEPTMRALAEAMWDAMGRSRPATLRPGEWHTPFVDFEDDEDNVEINNHYHSGYDSLDHEALAIRVSVARCARVSYESFETGRRSTVEEDLRLYARLVGAQPLHASPAEHQATPDARSIHDQWKVGYEHGNFVGWRQHRKTLSGEAVAPIPEEHRR